MLGPNVTVRLVLTLSEATDLIEAVLALTSSTDVFTANALTCDIDTQQDKQ